MWNMVHVVFRTGSQCDFIVLGVGDAGGRCRQVGGAAHGSGLGRSGYQVDSRRGSVDASDVAHPFRKKFIRVVIVCAIRNNNFFLIAHVRNEFM